MDLRPITDKTQYNKLVTHVIQSWEWGEFRESLGLPLLRFGIFRDGKLTKAFQLTLHKIPFTKQYVGYLPKGPFPDSEMAQALKEIGKKHSCAFIKIEPDIIRSVIPSNEGIQLNKSGSDLDPRLRGDDNNLDLSFIPSPKPLFTKYNFVIDLRPSEENLLKSFHQKTRYNIKVAQKHGVKVEISTSDKAFEDYLKLYFETTKRQNYHGHDENYHRKVWASLKTAGIAQIAVAYYRKKPLTAWMLLSFKDILYYPYGGSSLENREVMANNLVAWEAIRFGKKLGLNKFDMWGSLGPNANPKHPWFGFHQFKQRYNGKLIEYLGTYDLVFNWPIYILFTVIDKLMPLKLFLLKIVYVWKQH